MPEITSRPYRPAVACERCVFGTGSHDDACPVGNADYWQRVCFPEFEERNEND